MYIKNGINNLFYMMSLVMNIKVNISFLIIKVDTDDEVILVFKLLDHFIHKIYHQAKKNDNVIIFILCVHEIIGVIGEAI